MESSLSAQLNQIITQLQPLKNLDIPILQQPEFLGALVGSITVLVVAIFNEPFLNRFIRRTKLVVKEAISHIQGKGDLIVYRLLIKNEGSYRAKDVEVDVEQIYENNKPRLNFLPVPLGWTHSHALNKGLVTRDIHPQQSVYLDICNYIKRNEGDLLRLSLKAGTEVEDFCQLKSDSTRIVLKAYQDSGQTIVINLLINWDGKNNPSISIKR